MSWNVRYSPSLGPLPPYSTSFASAQNPIVEDGGWALGGTTGLDWQNPRTAVGYAYGSGPSDVSYNDNLAVRQNQFSPVKHYSEIKIRKIGGYTPPSTHEVECLVGNTISANSNRGYELDFGWDFVLQMVRLNGPSGDFDTGVFTTVQGGTFTVAHDDVCRAYYDSISGSPIISIYKNSLLQWVVTDTTAGKVTSGSPGMGFFFRSGTGLDATKYAISAFAAGNW